MRINSQLKIFLILCTLIAVILSLLLMYSGPRIRMINFDSYDLTNSQNPRIFLHANQPLKKDAVPSITVSPIAAFTPLVSGETIIIEFTSALKYSTEYSITVSDFISSSTGRRGTYDYSFKTRSPAFIYLKRTAKDQQKNDSVVLHDAGNETILYEADRINKIAPFGSSFVIVSQGSDKDSIAIYDKKAITHIPLNMNEQVSNVYGNEDGSLIGYNATSSTDNWRSVLSFYDTVAGVVFRVNGLDEEPLSVKDWMFMPDGQSIAAITKTNDLVVVDIKSENITPLGYADSLKGIDSALSLIVGNKGKFEKIALDTLQRTLLTTTLYVGQGPMLGNYIPASKSSDEALTNTTFYSYVDSSYVNAITFRENNQDVELLKFLSKDTLLLDLRITANGGYALVESADTDGVTFDDYRLSSKPATVTTKILDTKSGESIGELNGFNVLEAPRGLYESFL